MKTRFLFVFARAPYRGIQTQEMLDMVLTAAAFDQSVCLLFIDDGIYSIVSRQNPAAIGYKDIGPVFESLREIYEVDQIYVESESLRERCISVEDLTVPTQPLPRSSLGIIMGQQNVIVNV